MSNPKKISNQLLMELNIIESPIFKFDKYSLEMEKSNQVEEYTKEWTDSSGILRKLHMKCDIRLPRQMEMDTLFALMELYINQHSPIIHNKEENKYSIKSNRVYFTFYELLQYMNKEISGQNVENLKKSIRILKSTNYKSMENGVFFDKENNKYVIDSENGFSLINKYSFESKRKISSDENMEISNERNWVEFDSFIINNIQNGYFKYLNSEKYYALPSGLYRRLYVYLEKQRYENKKPVKILRRKYITLADKLPIDYKYKSEIKKRIKSCEKKLREINFITDVDYQKEYVDFYFVGKKEDYIKNEISAESEERPKTYLRILSDDLISELVNRGVHKRNAKALIAGKSKWEVKKIIMYADKQLWLGKIKENLAGLLRTALENDFNVDYETDIVEFIDKLKFEEETKRKAQDESYDDYINAAIEKFKKENEDLYNIYREQAYMAIKANPANILSVEENLNDFTEKGYDSNLVKDKLLSILKFHLNLKSKEEFDFTQK